MPRTVILAALFLLGTATLTFAAGKKMGATPVASTAAAAPAPVVLTVPDVRGQAYVFAKGMLEDAGFAWRVSGSVKGFAANDVVSQDPAPGTRVVDTGSPTIVLGLAANKRYAQSGAPENASPYPGTEIRRVGTSAPAKPKPKRAAKPKAALKPAKPAAKPKSKPKPKPARAATKPAPRPPAFVVEGAPAEPLDEMPLPDRARRLERWLGTHPRPTDANVRHWLYQHAWVVTGARFGWWRGAEALRILIQADRRAERVWGIGDRSRSVAQAALADVEARSR